MILIEESEGVYLFDRDGSVCYYTEEYTQLKKFNEEAAVIITSECLVFATEVKIDGQYILSVVIDNQFESAFIYEDHVYVRRKYLLPVLDVYNKELVNVLRLYKNITNQWAVLLTWLGIPYRSLAPIGLKGKLLFCRKGKQLGTYNVLSRKFKSSSSSPENKVVETALIKMKELEVYK